MTRIARTCWGRFAKASQAPRSQLGRSDLRGSALCLDFGDLHDLECGGSYVCSAANASVRVAHVGGGCCNISFCVCISKSRLRLFFSQYCWGLCALETS